MGRTMTSHHRMQAAAEPEPPARPRRRWPASAAGSTLLEARCGRRVPTAPRSMVSIFWARSASLALSARSRAVSSARRDVRSRVGEATAIGYGWRRPASVGAGNQGPVRCRWRRRPRPRMMPSSVSSKVAPTMMLASWSTSSRNPCRGFVDPRTASGPCRPVIEIKRPRAPFIEVDRRSSGWRSPPRLRSRRASRRKPRRAHHRLAHLAHHGADVGEVEVDSGLP